MRLTTLAASLATLVAFVTLNACYTGTIDAVSTFDVQLPIEFAFEFYNRQTPDTTSDHVDLNDYAMYRDNREDILNSTPYQIAFWLESMQGDPAIDTAEFTVVEFFIQFDGETDLVSLARFENVKASDYLLAPHIMPIEDSTAAVVANALKTRPSFTLIQRCGNPTTGAGTYSEIKARVDVALRLEIEL